MNRVTLMQKVISNTFAAPRKTAAPHALGKSVLVLGSDERSFLTAVRSFGRAGFNVDVGWCTDEHSIALKSRYIRNRVELPAADGANQEWISEINNLVSSRGYDFVLPCHDAQVVPLQEHCDGLEFPERFAIVPTAAYELASNKHQLHAFALKCGVPVPEQVVVQSPEEVASAGSRLGYPLYLKPERSTDVSAPLWRNEVLRIDRPEDIAGIPLKLLHQGYRAQRAVEGHGIGINVLAFEGKILTALQHERLHEPATGGGSSYRRSMALDPKLLEYCARLLGPIGYTGPAMVEFKAQRGGEQPYLMEINCRLWGSLALTVAAGFDVPLFWYQMQREGRRDFPKSYPENVFCRHWAGEMNWVGSNFKARRSLSSHKIVVPPLQIARELLNIPAGREYSDTFSFDDPKPGLVEVNRIGRKIARSARDRLWPERWYFRRKAVPIVATAESFLFVCFGNICRSPFAEILGSKLLDARMASAGFYPKNNRRSPPQAVSAARKLGVDLSNHKSKALTREMLEEADVVFVFDRSNQRDILKFDPSCARKLVFLGCFGNSFEVSDPYGQSNEAFSACYDGVQLALEKIAEIRLGKR